MSEKTGGETPPAPNSNSDDEFKDISSFNLENKYKFSDRGPYNVYVEHLKNNFGRLFPMKIGYYLLENNEFKNDIIDIVSVGVSRVKVVFKTFSIANSLIQHEIVTKNSLVAYVPNFFNHRKGIVRMVDTFFTEDFLLKNIECDNTTITGVQRMKRRVTDNDGNQKLVDRQMVIVNFTGNIIPDKVRINLTYFPVEPYIQPVVQCFKCLRYGHTAKLCKSKTQRCKSCSEVHESDAACSDPNPFCIHCQSDNHSSMSKNCPMYSKQFQIKKEMSVRNVSFKEAEKIVSNPTYAKIATHNQFSVLNNDVNFPPLSGPRPIQYPPKLFIQKPKQPTNSKKRKPISPPPVSPPTAKKSQTIKEKKSVLPNPYRDEFMQHKEKIISDISAFIQQHFVNKSHTTNESENSQQHIREIVNSIMGKDVEQISDIYSISDNDSCY